MELLKKIKDVEVWYTLWQGGDQMRLPFEGQPFACILWSNIEGFVSPPLLKMLLQKQCIYFVIGGKNCEQWHDEADHIFLEQYYPDYVFPDNEMVCTTWHEGESIREVLWFGFNCTSDRCDKTFKNFLIIQVGKKYSIQQMGKLVDELSPAFFQEDILQSWGIEV